MQYGNFYSVLMLFLFLLSFKSYYVVWKPSSTRNVSTQVSLFKSYYVVWKQDMKKKIKEMEEQFKSYYVVWKPYPLLCIHHTLASLNRTMQYGNFFLVFVQAMPSFEFKSYYVVWKRWDTKEKK